MSKRNMNKVEEPVRVEESIKPFKGFTYSHPSFGIARFARVHGTKSDMYGSKVDANDYIELSISESSCEQDLVKGWYQQGSEVIKVAFSATQFAELLTNMNSMGVPCTINYRQDMGNIITGSIPKEIDYIKDKIDQKIDDRMDKVIKIQKEMTDLLSQSGNLKKADKDRLKRLTTLLVTSANESFPFYADSAKKSIEKATQESKAEMEAFRQHVLTSLGSKLLENPEALNKLLLEQK